MDALTGRHQTTRGIWLAMAPKVPHPHTLVLDLEGSDGRERGEDDTSFERQSSLFALAVADIVLVNMWAKDIGRETGSGKPLLKTIFQVQAAWSAADRGRGSAAGRGDRINGGWQGLDSAAGRGDRSCSPWSGQKDGAVFCWWWRAWEGQLPFCRSVGAK